MIDGFVHPAFAGVAARFDKIFRKPGNGGGGLAAYLQGECVLDVWGGWIDPDATNPWQRDTMSMSFSTSKGVASTVVHRLADRGLLEYDLPLTTWWPEFGQHGKEMVTLRHLMSHRTGLHGIRELLSHPNELLDHRLIADLLADAKPTLPPGGPPAYHGLTYGWLVAALVERVTGDDFPKVLAREVSDPLDLDGCFIGLPEAEHGRVAPLFPGLNPGGYSVTKLAGRLERRPALRPFVDALLVDGFDELAMSTTILSAVAPAVNGVFTARSLAKMYGALANGGKVEGTRFLDPVTVREMGRIQTRERDRVVAIPMKWRLGYHRAFTSGRQPRMGFGHFGFGGSGGWADPETGLSVGFVTNRLGTATTPFGDARLARLGAAALDAANKSR